MDSFNIVFGCSEYISDSFCYYCSINDRLRIADYLTQPIEYAKHNCFNTYVANIVKPLTVTASRGELTVSNAIAGTLIEEWDSIHKKYSFVGETYDGTYFRGTMPFTGINVKFNNDYSRINTSRTGLGIPKYYNYTDSNGNVHIYNGSAWKQMT